MVRQAPAIRGALTQYFYSEVQGPLSGLYERYAVDIVLLNPEDEQKKWNFTVIEVNPLFELTGEALFENEEGRKIIHGEMDADYPVMRVQELNIVDGTEKRLLRARREIERELGILSS